MLTNRIPHRKCFARYLSIRCLCIRNLTCTLRSLFRFLIRQQLVRKLKYRTRALSTEVRFYTILTRKWRTNFFPDSWQKRPFSFFFTGSHFCVVRSIPFKLNICVCMKWNDQHVTSVGQRRNLSSPRQESNLWPSKHRTGALSTWTKEN